MKRLKHILEWIVVVSVVAIGFISMIIFGAFIASLLIVFGGFILKGCGVL